MEKTDKLWRGLREEAREALSSRDYSQQSLEQRLWDRGMSAGEIFGLLTETPDALDDLWIPGVELFPRQVFVQRHRGFFGELGRQEEGVFEKIGFWPRQWSASLIYAGTCKGFHIHPPFLEQGEDAVERNRRIFGSGKPRFDDCPADREQWDVMFFLMGRVEILLIDERAGLPRRRLRFWIDGDNHRGRDNAGLVIPPGVAHALRPEGSEDLLMTYGTTTTFRAEAEGRLYSGIETAELPGEWQTYFEKPTQPQES